MPDLKMTPIPIPMSEQKRYCLHSPMLISSEGMRVMADRGVTLDTLLRWVNTIGSGTPTLQRGKWDCALFAVPETGLTCWTGFHEHMPNGQCFYLSFDRDRRGDSVEFDHTEGTGAPTAPPGPRWTGDRGAIPGEPMYTLDADEDKKQGHLQAAAIFEIEVGGRGRRWQAAMDGGGVIAESDSLAEVAAEAEARFPNYEEGCCDRMTMKAFNAALAAAKSPVRVSAEAQESVAEDDVSESPAP